MEARNEAHGSTDPLRVNHLRPFGADSTGSSLKATVPVFRRHASTNSARVEVVSRYVGGLEERPVSHGGFNCKLVIRHNPRLMAADQQVTGVGGRHCFPVILMNINAGFVNWPEKVQRKQISK